MQALSLDVTRVTAFVHRSVLQIIALATIVSVVVTQYGPGVGLTSAQIAYIAGGAVAIATLLRSISDGVSQQIEQTRSSINFWVGEYWKVKGELDTLKGSVPGVGIPQPSNIPPATVGFTSTPPVAGQ